MKPSGTGLRSSKNKLGKINIQSTIVGSSTVPSPSPTTPCVLKRLAASSPPVVPVPVSERSVEEKRLLIRKQLVILLHSVVCRRRDLNFSSHGQPSNQCNVPFCGLMKTVLIHLNSCKAGRSCGTTHCASSRQILIHWKYCVKTECPVCVSLRQVVPTSLLTIFANPLCRAEVMKRIARQQRQQNEASHDQAVPELMESEE